MEKTSHGEQRLLPEVMIDAIHDQHARVAWDIPEIRPHTWAIHGTTDLDGEVILAEFASRDAARAVLDSLGATEGEAGADAGQ